MTELKENCRAAPDRLMCGVQAFKAHIGGQLLPTSRFVAHLEGAGSSKLALCSRTVARLKARGAPA